MLECKFINDNDVVIKLPNHELTEQYKTRVHAETFFRRIVTYFINNNIISNNFIDLGAWMGDNSIPWAVNIMGTVFAIDPSPQNCEFISLLAQLNNINNIKVIQKAISDNNEILSTNDPINHCVFVNNSDGQTKVNAESLDYLFDINEINSIGFIHLDVEGMEFKVILGSENIIKKFKPIIAFEQHIESDNYLELSEHIRQFDYQIYLINESFNGCRHDCRNLLAIPNEKIQNDLINELQKHLNKNDLLIKLLG
jgi:FkbM family methyltransferase